MAVVIVAQQKNDEIKEEVYEFDKNTRIDILLSYATGGWAFRIPLAEDREIWNNLFKTKWRELDDSDSYYYSRPYVNTKKWMSADEGHFVLTQDAIKSYQKSIEFLKKVKNLYGGKF